MFLMGFAQEAYKYWVASKAFQQFKPRKIVPPPAPPIEVAPALLDGTAANVRVTAPTINTSAMLTVISENAVALPVDSVVGSVAPFLPRVEYATYQEALARKGTRWAKPLDEVVLSHGMSRGVNPRLIHRVSL